MVAVARKRPTDRRAADARRPYTSRMIPRTIAQAVVGDGGLSARSDDFDEDWGRRSSGSSTAFGLPAGVVRPGVPVRRAVRPAARGGRLGRGPAVPIPGPAAAPCTTSSPTHSPSPTGSRPRWDDRGPLPTLEWPEEPLPRADGRPARRDLQARRRAVPARGVSDAGGQRADRSCSGPSRIRSCAATCGTCSRTAPGDRRGRRRSPIPTTLGFGLVVLPAVPEGGLPGYLTEDQARDYPESRYERELQVAVEHGDQRTVDRLLARRSSAETLRLAFWIVLAAAVVFDDRGRWLIDEVDERAGGRRRTGRPDRVGYGTAGESRTGVPRSRFD